MSEEKLTLDRQGPAPLSRKTSGKAGVAPQYQEGRSALAVRPTDAPPHFFGSAASDAGGAGDESGPNQSVHPKRSAPEKLRPQLVDLLSAPLRQILDRKLFSFISSQCG